MSLLLDIKNNIQEILMVKLTVSTSIDIDSRTRIAKHDRKICFKDIGRLIKNLRNK